MDANDEKLLFGGKWFICAMITKSRLIKQLDTLIKDADRKLQKYPATNFYNFDVTARLIEEIALEVEIWSAQVDGMCAKFMGEGQSVLQRQFHNFIPISGLSSYDGMRDLLVKKKDLLLSFRNDIVTYDVWRKK